MCGLMDVIAKPSCDLWPTLNPTPFRKHLPQTLSANPEDPNQDMFKDIYLRAFWSLTKKDPRAFRVSKEAYPESSVVTSTRISHSHLVNTSELSAIHIWSFRVQEGTHNSGFGGQRNLSLGDRVQGITTGF